jgi:hypothetical protein
LIDKDKIRAIDLATFCQDKLGMRVVHDIGGRVYFYSPFRAETVPSFTVSRRTNKYRDWGIDTTDRSSSGDVIQLVMSVENVDFKTALKHITGDYQRDEAPKFEPLEEKQELPGILIVEERTIKDKTLVNYIEHRGIDIDLCRKYCSEVDVRFPYSKKDPDELYTVIGFRNDSGGYEVRNSWMKRSTRPKTIRTVHGDISDEWCIFEGFFDYLSALMFFGVDKLEMTAVVLNTTAFLGSLYPFLAENKMNWMYLDRDATGRKKIDEMKQYGIPYTDCSYIYEDYKDLNELWTNQG